MITKILVCSDGSEPAKQAVHLAAQMAKAHQAELLLLSVYDPSPLWLLSAVNPGVIITDQTVEREAKERLDFLERCSREWMEAEGTPCRYLRQTGYPVEQIVQTAEREQEDLIVLGSRGLSKWKSLLLGSVANGVLHHAPCPTLIAR